MSADNTARIAILLDAAQATTAARQTSKEIDQIGASGKAAGAAASSGLNSVERASRGAAVSQAQLQQIYQNVAAAQGENSVAAQRLAVELGKQSVVQGNVTVTALEAARAEQTLALANTEVATTAELSSRQMILTAGAASRVAGAAIPGAKALGTLAGAFSAASLPQLLLIVGIGILIGELFKLGKATEDQIELDNKQIELDVRHSQAMHTGTLFTQERATVLHDQNALNAQLKQSVTALNDARAQESIAIGHSNQGMRDNAAGYDNLITKSGIYIYSLFASTGSETEATKARLEATKAVNEQVEARIQFAAETHKTTEALVAEMHAVLGDTDAFKRFVDAMREGVYVQAQLKAGHDAEAAAVRRVADAAAMAGEKTLTHSEMVRRVNADLTRQSEESYILAQQSKTAEANLKAYGETHEKVSHAAQQAMREESILFQLRKENYALDERLGKNNFEEQREIIKQEYADRRKLEHDKAVLRKASADEIRTIDYELVAQEMKALNLSVNAEIEYNRKVTEEREKLAEHDQAMEEKRVKEHARTIEELRRLDHKLLADQLKDEQDAEGKRAQFLLKQLVDTAKAANEARKFLFSSGQDASSDGITRFLNQLKELGPAFKDVDKDAAATRTAIDYVRGSFDFSSKSAEMFQLKLDLLTGHTVTFGQTFTAVISEMFTTVSAMTAIFEGIGQAISSVFEGIITGTSNAKAAFLEFLATLLMQMGQMAIAIGTIMLFIPGYGGLGVALIAAGIAAEALAGVFKGLASNSQKSSQSASGSSAASGATATQQPNPAAPPKVIAFPTSSAAAAAPTENKFSKIGWHDPNKPMVVHIQVDKQGLKSALTDEGFMTEGRLRQETSKTPVGRAIKKLAS